MTNAALTSGIIVQGLELPVTLGWLPDEREHPQNVVIDFNLKFLTPPQACQTDELEDTICYFTLTESLRQKIVGNEFRLLEHLGQVIYQHLKDALTQNIKIGIRLCKNPPIKNLTGGIYFYYGDENFSW